LASEPPGETEVGSGSKGLPKPLPPSEPAAVAEVAANVRGLSTSPAVLLAQEDKLVPPTITLVTVRTLTAKANVRNLGSTQSNRCLIAGVMTRT
jgi:hypothetical protein